MLSPIQLEELFEALGTPEIGRSMIRKARKEAPVRQVRSNWSNLVSRYPSQKMQRVIETESHTAEFPAMYLYEFDPNVLEYFPQPMEVDQRLALPSGKKDRFQHTPDFLLITPDGFVVEEWRYEARLLKLALVRPDRFIRQEKEWRFPLAEDYFAERGIAYRLRSAEELPRQYIQNLDFLRVYLQASCPPPSPEELKALKQAFEDRASIHISELVEWPGISTDTVYKAIADRILAFDLHSDNLGETHRVQAYRDEPTMRFLQQSAAPSVGIPQERLDCSIEPGGRIVMDKQEFEILCVGEDNVTTTCGGKTTEFKLDIIERLHQLGELKIFSDALSPMGNPVDGSMLADFSPAQLDVALTRAQWIQQAAVDPKSVPRSPRTIRRYREAARLGGDSALEKNLALIPKDCMKGDRRRKLSMEILDLIKTTAREHYNKPRNQSQTNAYQFFSNACNSAGLRPCSFRTFSQELRILASTRARMGKRMAYQQARFVNYLHIFEEVHGVRPFQIVHIDHTTGFAGAQQPGMTGQVKEDILSRLGEMGVQVSQGRIAFLPWLVPQGEFLRDKARFSFLDVAGEPEHLDLEPGSFAFTLCQVPVVVHRTGTPGIRILRRTGAVDFLKERGLDAVISKAIFHRTGEVRRLDVCLGLPA